VALFRKKPPKGDDGDAKDSAFTPQPEKARKWFEHARTAADASNHAYALSCFANGIKLDPGSMSAHEAMWDAAVRYLNLGEKPASGKVVRSFEDGTAIGKFAAAEFEWMNDLKNHKAAIRALDTAIKAEQLEFGNWAAPKVFNMMGRSEKKLTKSLLLQAMELFRQVGAWDESMAAGEAARQLDPSDNDLDAELKNLSAQRAMDQGGYIEAAGEEGSFRKFIKDADKQNELLDEEALAGGGSLDERNLSRAKRAYDEAPALPDVINRFAQLLKKQGIDESTSQALDIYRKGYEDTGEYRFRMYAGDIEIEELQKKLTGLDEKLTETPDDAATTSQREDVRRRLLELRLTEYTARVAKYPTDRMRKYELGTVQFDLANYDDAMAQFQAAKDEPKLRVPAGHMLGRCFFADKWYNEAISEFEEALQVIEVTEKERELAIRYDLMLALLAGAQDDNAVDMAKQAKDICSEIARKDITYRDIRARRREVDQVIKSLIAG